MTPPPLILPDATLREAFDKLRHSGHGVLVVIDAEGTVVGTVSDSHIRRAALAHPALDAPVTAAMSRRPVTAAPDDSDERVLGLLRAHRLRAVPVVGDEVVAVRSIAEFPEAEPPPPVAVVMVGGRGKRLRPLTDKRPKPLLRVGGHAIVERIILSLAAAGVRDVYLTVSYLAELFQSELGDGGALGVRLHYVAEEEPLDTAGGLSLLPDDIDVPILVTNGDLVTTIDFGALFDFHRHQQGAITVTGVEHRTHVPYGVLTTVEHHLLSIDEKPDRVDFVNAGMYVLSPEVRRFVPQGSPYKMTDLIADVAAEGLPVHVFPVLERWFDIGSPEEFERVLVSFATGEEE